MGTIYEPRKLAICEVKEAIHNKNASKIECNFMNEKISIEYFEEIIVDPIEIINRYNEKNVLLIMLKK